VSTSNDLTKATEEETLPEGNNIKRLELEQAFHRSGAFGRFQFFSSAVNTIVNGACMFFFNSFTFLEVEPQVMCDIDGKTIYSS